MIAGRNLLWLMPLLLLATYPLWQPTAADLLKPRGRSGRQPVEIAAGQPGGSRIDMGEVDLSQLVNGVEEWRLHAVRLVSSASDTIFDLEGVRALLYGGEGATAGPVTIHGDRGKYDSKARLLTLADNVVVETTDGKVMRTQRLSYLADAKLLKASNGVHLASASFDVRGTNLTYDLAGESFRLAGGVICKVW